MWLIPEEMNVPDQLKAITKKPDEAIKINIPEELKTKYKEPNDTISGWESPIETTYQRISRDVQEKEDAYIIEEICNIGVDVKKEELIKALNYDRQQYEQGYKNGYKAGYEKGIDICFEKLKEIIKEMEVNNNI